MFDHYLKVPEKLTTIKMIPLVPQKKIRSASSTTWYRPGDSFKDKDTAEIANLPVTEGKNRNLKLGDLFGKITQAGDPGHKNQRRRTAIRTDEGADENRRKS